MILRLSELLSRAVEQTLEDKIAISFSGGLDSTVIATIAKKHSNVELFAAGTEGSEDIIYAEKVASQLNLPLTMVQIDEKSAMDVYHKCHSFLPLEFLKLEIMVPVHFTAEAAAKKGHKVMLFGSAAEELFVGYEKYYIARDEGKDLEPMPKEEFRTLPQRDMSWVKKVCRCFDIDARFPFHNRELGELMFSVPIEERMDDREMKKGLLREAAKVLGTPELAIKRKKKAMQYGSGVHKVFMRNIKEINKTYPRS